jgi:hypothetical protein
LFAPLVPFCSRGEKGRSTWTLDIRNDRYS